MPRAHYRRAIVLYTTLRVISTCNKVQWGTNYKCQCSPPSSIRDTGHHKTVPKKKKERKHKNISSHTTSGPLLLHKPEPLAKSLEERGLQLRPGPTRHNRSMSGTIDREHVPSPSDQIVRHRTRGMGQSLMVYTLGFPKTKASAKLVPFIVSGENMTYWQDSGCHCEKTGTTPSFLCNSSRSFPVWMARMKSGNGWILDRSYEHMARDRMNNGKLKKCETLGAKPVVDS